MREMKDSGIEWCKSIPADWRVLRIKYIMYERREKTRTGEEEPLSVTQKYGIVKTKDIEVANPSVSYDDYIIVSRNDIVFNKYKAHSGVFFVTPYDGIVTFNYSVYRCYNGFNPKYYEYLFHTQGCIGEFKTRLHGVGESISPLYTKDLYSVTVFAPTFEEQNRIVTYLDSICAEINTTISDIEREIEVLEEYKRSVITEAVTKGLDPDVEMRDSGIAWVGDIPAHWLVEKVKFHLQRNEPRNPGDKQVLSVYREYGVIPKDSRDDNHNVTSEDTSNYKYVVPGNLVINKMKAWQGSMGVSEYEGIVSPAYFIYKFTDNQIMPKYLHYLFRSCYKDEFRRISGGIREGQWDLSPYEFSNTLLLIPPTDEQNRIVSYIDARISEIEFAITEKKQQIETIKEYKKSLIFEYVTGKKEVQA